MTYWVVTMYRYVDHEKHSYVLGVYSSFELALKYGNIEVENRGGKYHFTCTAAVLDEPVLLLQEIED